MKRVQKKGRWKLRGISTDAAALGAHRVHLALVLKGKRTGHSLLQRYHDLKTAQKQTSESHETKSL